MSSGSTVHLSRQAGTINALTVDPKLENALHWYAGYSTKRNYYSNYERHDPEVSETVEGGKQIWNVDINQDVIAMGHLEFSIENISVDPDTNPAPEPFLIDGAGFGAIEKVVVSYGNNEVQTIYPDEIFYKLHNFYDVNEEAIRSVEVGWGLSVSERKDRALGKQTFICDIPFHWSKGPEHNLHLRQLATRPKISVFWNRIDDILNVDGGQNPQLDITDAHFKFDSTYFEAAERDMYTRLLDTEDGIVKMITEFKWDGGSTAQALIPAGTTGDFRYELKNFRSVTRTIGFYLRRKAWVDPNIPIPGEEAGRHDKWWIRAGDTVFYEDFNNFRVVSNRNDDLFDAVTPFEAKTVLKRKHFTSGYGDNFFFWSFADSPEDEVNATGGYNLNAVTNPTLIINFSNPVTEDLELVVINIEYNWVQQNRGNYLTVMTN